MEQKRISITVTTAPFEELQAIAKTLGLNNRWFSREIDTLVQGLLPCFRKILEETKKEKKMTEQEMLRFVVDSMEKAQGQAIKKLL